MNRKAITKAIRASVAEAIYCEGFKGDVLLRVNDNCKIYKIQYTFNENVEPERESIEALVNDLKERYPDCSAVTLHFKTPGMNENEIGKVTVNFHDKFQAKFTEYDFE